MFGAEGLIRWRDDHGGLVPPGEFLGLAEEMGLLESIGEWAFKELCRQDEEWRAQGHGPPARHEPVRRASCGRPDSRIRCLSRLREAGSQPNRVTIEVSEATVMADPAHAQKVMAELKAWGLRLAIDDFGMGQSSLSRVATLPADVLEDRPIGRARRRRRPRPGGHGPGDRGPRRGPGHADARRGDRDRDRGRGHAATWVALPPRASCSDVPFPAIRSRGPCRALRPSST